ncbi:MAG: hypothetical protein F8N37_01805 [Telmatospirillum sp.]|nr:hypothetical protein [Telmatospirillum sp.]
MTHFGRTSTIVAACGLSLALFAGSCRPATAQQLVWDPSEIALLAEKSAHMAEALSRAADLLDAVNELSRTVGRFGSLSTAGLWRFDLAEGLKGAGPEIGEIAGRVGGLRHARIRSYDDALALARTLTAPVAAHADVTTAGKVRQLVDTLRRKALEDGYALSLHAREGASTAPDRARILTDEAQASRDARGDVAADTAASLAVYEELCTVRTLLGSILEIRSMSRIAGSGGETR